MIKKSHAVILGFFVGVFATYAVIKIASAGYSFGQGLAQNAQAAPAKESPPR
jgi:hypothetical protein